MTTITIILQRRAMNFRLLIAVLITITVSLLFLTGMHRSASPADVEITHFSHILSLDFDTLPQAKAAPLDNLTMGNPGITQILQSNWQAGVFHF